MFSQHAERHALLQEDPHLVLVLQLHLEDTHTNTHTHTHTITCEINAFSKTPASTKAGDSLQMLHAEGLQVVCGCISAAEHLQIRSLACFFCLTRTNVGHNRQENYLFLEYYYHYTDSLVCTSSGRGQMSAVLMYSPSTKMNFRVTRALRGFCNTKNGQKTLRHTTH